MWSHTRPVASMDPANRGFPTAGRDAVRTACANLGITIPRMLSTINARTPSLTRVKELSTFVGLLVAGVAIMAGP